MGRKEEYVRKVRQPQVYALELGIQNLEIYKENELDIEEMMVMVKVLDLPCLHMLPFVSHKKDPSQDSLGSNIDLPERPPPVPVLQPNSKPLKKRTKDKSKASVKSKGSGKSSKGSGKSSKGSGKSSKGSGKSSKGSARSPKGSAKSSSAKSGNGRLSSAKSGSAKSSSAKSSSAKSGSAKSSSAKSLSSRSEKAKVKVEGLSSREKVTSRDSSKKSFKEDSVKEHEGVPKTDDEESFSATQGLENELELELQDPTSIENTGAYRREELNPYEMKKKRLELLMLLEPTVEEELLPGVPFKSELCCMFAWKGALDLVYALQRTPLVIYVLKKKTGLLIGKTCLRLGPEFQEAATKAALLALTPVFAYIQGMFPLTDMDNELVGKLLGSVRLSCYGSCARTNLKSVGGDLMDRVPWLREFRQREEFDPVQAVSYSTCTDRDLLEGPPIVSGGDLPPTTSAFFLPPSFLLHTSLPPPNSPDCRKPLKSYTF